MGSPLMPEPNLAFVSNEGKLSITESRLTGWAAITLPMQYVVY